mmetsp:Transcript_7587/g.12258  ORF Transcript_7587/g.12258 Transcript_7587/m.12258 type:complete len:585 (+) Transcript_7587:130-1884(+)|eukprot:CAMPEP_0203757916 /NCGR_PEP_ID=MMETSP0098-20131031/10749_1 /ASSEMBLY_ACC=CAM_ASM_000208 /TAXON_ID=96639 /ORGANISM=" , Strain NY0313808BC1" /LENGTH=584 /DNA_ID=CAMNT_0050650161 /DNA_START=119 /DNA_END=1873 /DNA_ORIENTATION=+
MQSSGEKNGSTHEKINVGDEGLEFVAFGSSYNLGGGGPPLIQREELPTNILHRFRRNMKLCGVGAVAGMGMFSESYFLFALGNIHEIWKRLYPACFDPADESCNDSIVESFTYVEVSGVICGMLTFGIFADILGRRWGSCSTATIMFVGGVLTTAAYASNLDGMFIFFLVALLVFAYGVGGEYPLASASAAERAEQAKKNPQLAAHHIRGKSVVFTFAMQGWGNWVNTLVIMLILLATNCTGETCSSSSLELTWRLQYGIGSFFLMILMIGRFVYLKESEVWKENQIKKKKLESEVAEARAQPGFVEDEGSESNVRLLLRHYWHRIVGTAGGWFVWDVVFYGNKLFQGKIIATIIGGEPTVYEVLVYTLINSTIALAGYYCAALTIDKTWMGRRRLQSIGMFFTFVLFLICGLLYDTLAKPENIGYFQALYYLSSFFGQFGPNSTTWLLPSELFPTQVRTAAHGFSAAAGKLGALTATFVFTYGGPGGTPLGSKEIFLVCSVCGLTGLFLTLTFIPDVTTLDLVHLDDRWELIVDGRPDDYHGDAIHPVYLSWFETVTGIGCDCPTVDCQQNNHSEPTADLSTV